MQSVPGHAPTLVIKLGTSTLTGGGRRLSRPHMVELVRQIAALRAGGWRVVVVSSGAIAAGREVLGEPAVPNHLPAKQMLSAVGQSYLMQVYRSLFDLYSLPIGQVLLTHDDLSHRTRYLNARETLQTLLDYGIVPIVNENDTVAVDEIKVGDNDTLSALIAVLLSASLLILLTDQDGLYDRDPRLYPDARLLEEVPAIDETVEAAAGATLSDLGVGGMHTKVQAARLATRSGTRTCIARGTVPDVLLRLARGERVGTVFSPAVGHIESRKRWLLAERPQGSLHIDRGAARVLREQGASLLPIGITRIDGQFERGAVVRVIDESRRTIAQGLVNYSRAELERLCGRHSTQIAQILGYTYGDEAIHRDNLVMMAV